MDCEIKISEFDYNLPQEHIALHPLEQRDSCKLLRRDSAGNISDHVFTEIGALLPTDAMLVYNNTRVINARISMRKSSGAAIEIFCLEPDTPSDYALNFASKGSCRWLCLVGNSKRWKDGDLTKEMNIDGRSVTLMARRIARHDNASVVEFEWNSDDTFATVVGSAGVIPIPPYLNRDTEQSDSTDYQTIYSHIEGSVAAPTAGLHFTERVLEDIDRRGIPRRELTLHVGAGTFQPVKDDNVADHVMHSEFISVPLCLIEELATTDRRVFAVGTTSVRTLESLYHAGCLMSQRQWQGEVPQWYPYAEDHPGLTVSEALGHIIDYLKANVLNNFIASTRIIIAPGYTYRIVKGMITNFHQPKSTLLLLVSAMIGDDWLRVYEHALSHGYRFLSYGDACLFG